ncbi:MAG: type II toxin-antitoxin system RelB/DinJ family antitoxin [Oscillospiraceae bacterium]|nr:type II toxin-antitoxin system RelB/DinJ family antitoxin [Oscillospiraceae bacterium]
MAQTNLTIRIDEGIKQEAETLFNKIGLNMSSAINVFFRQAIREQSIPFTLKPYDDYYTGENLKRLKHSIEQSERGETIDLSFAELEAMETGAIPQRALDFLAKHKGDCQ